MLDFVTHPLIEPSWLTAHLAGYRDLALYDASWEEWGTDASLPVAGASE